jgi:hypothetical protein
MTLAQTALFVLFALLLGGYCARWANRRAAGENMRKADFAHAGCLALMLPMLIAPLMLRADARLAFLALAAIAAIGYGQALAKSIRSKHTSDMRLHAIHASMFAGMGLAYAPVTVPALLWWATGLFFFGLTALYGRCLWNSVLGADHADRFSFWRLQPVVSHLLVSAAMFGMFAAPSVFMAMPMGAAAMNGSGMHMSAAMR